MQIAQSISELPDQQEAHLAADVAQVLRLQRHIHAATGGASDPRRVLGIVAAAPSAEQYLAYSIPRLLDQIAASGRQGDLVIGFNNGFASPPTIAHLRSLPDTELIELYTRPKTAPAAPAPSATDRSEGGAHYRVPQATAGRHRLFVVHQHASPYAAGKIRIYDDIVRGLLLPSVEAGWTPPRYMLAFDAETIFIAHDNDRGLQHELAQVDFLLERMGGSVERVVGALIQAHRAAGQRGQLLAPQAEQPTDLSRNGLAPAFAALDSAPELRIVGAITRFCVYQPQAEINGLPIWLPNFAAPFSAMHAIYNYTCGLLPGCMCMAGGGTIGHTAHMLSLLATISAAYPGTTSEDALLTVLAEQAGWPMRLCDQVWMTNRCPTLEQLTNHTPPRLAWQQQFVRWYAGFDAVEQLYGRRSAQAVLGPSNGDYLRASLAIFWKTLRRSNDLPASMELLQQLATCGSAYEQIRALALESPDELAGPRGRPAW